MDITILYAVIAGVSFGFVLDRIGATNPNLIIRMLTFRDLYLMKVILMGIGVGSLLMFAGQMLGIVEVGHMSVKTAYLGVIIGGMIMGLGWAISGYCPGTGLVAAASGRRDALFFIVGGLLGGVAYMKTYPFIKSLAILEPIAGGKVTLGAIPGAKYGSVTAIQGDILGIATGVVFIIIAFLLPNKIR